MKAIKITALLFFGVIITSCNNSQRNKIENAAGNLGDQVEHTFSQDHAEVSMINVPLNPKTNSQAQGNAVFTDKNGKVYLEVEMTGLTPHAKHAIHLHEKGDCGTDASDDAKAAGGHWNPTSHAHGEWGEHSGYHQGDIGNLNADKDGKATLKFDTDQWCINCADESKNIMFKSVVVHEGQDDFKTQPTGGAGTRIACGVIVE